MRYQQEGSRRKGRHYSDGVAECTDRKRPKLKWGIPLAPDYQGEHQSNWVLSHILSAHHQIPCDEFYHSIHDHIPKNQYPMVEQERYETRNRPPSQTISRIRPLTERKYLNIPFLQFAVNWFLALLLLVRALAKLMSICTA